LSLGSISASEITLAAISAESSVLRNERGSSKIDVDSLICHQTKATSSPERNAAKETGIRMRDDGRMWFKRVQEREGILNQLGGVKKEEKEKKR